MKIWITGSQGLVGKNLTPRLHDHQVIGTDVVTDIRTLDLKSDVPAVDLIINLAALNSSKDSIERPGDYFATNVAGNFNMLEIAKATGAKFMYLTTMKEAETNPYGVSKHCASSWVHCYRETYDMPAILNMVGNLYGPHGDNFWVNIFMKKAKNREQITVFGDGSASRDMLYIDDLVDLLVDQIENFDLYAKHHLVPVGGGKDNVLSVNDLLKWLEYDRVTYQDGLPGLQQDRVTDNRRVSAINSWAPSTSLDEGLQKTYESI